MTVIDRYLETVTAVQKAELERIRRITHAQIPGCTEAIHYNMPTILYQGKPVIGFAARARHIGIYPYGGGIIAKIPELASYHTSKGAIRENINELMPDSLIQKILAMKMQQLQDKG